MKFVMQKMIVSKLPASLEDNGASRIGGQNPKCAGSYKETTLINRDFTNANTSVIPRQKF